MKVLLRIASILYIMCGVALIPLGIYCHWLAKEAGTAILNTEDINGFLPNADSIPGLVGDLLSESGLAVLCSICIVGGSMAILMGIFGLIGSRSHYVPLSVGLFFSILSLILSVAGIVASLMYNIFEPYSLLSLIIPLLYAIGGFGVKQRLVCYSNL